MRESRDKVSFSMHAACATSQDKKGVKCLRMRDAFDGLQMYQSFIVNVETRGSGT